MDRMRRINNEEKGLEEDEEEEDMDRRSSHRNRKRVKYNEDDDDDDDEEEEDDDDDEEEEEEDQEDDEQPGTSTQNTHYQRAQEKKLWSVTCGNKRGILHKEKLARSEECIECEGRWFTPGAFEEFGGKGFSKKWKYSISSKNRPLQFWIEEGLLTTKGFKRRGSGTMKRKEILTHHRTSESSSEEEGEEERVGAEKIDSEVDKSKEEEDENEKEEMEDEAMPAVDDNDKDNSVFEERDSELIISALQKEVRIVIERLPEDKRDCQSYGTERPQKENEEEREHSDSTVDDLTDPSQMSPVDGGAEEEKGEFMQKNEEEREHSDSTVDDLTDPSQMSPVDGGAEEEKGEFMQSNELKEEEQGEIKIELSPPSSFPDIRPDMLKEDIGSSSSHSASLTTSSLLLVTQGTSNADVASNSTPIESDGQLHVIKTETRLPQASDSTQYFIRVEGPISTYSDQDTMDLDQLKREKIKMQLKVLKLQEEYYTLIINNLKK